MAATATSPDMKTETTPELGLPYSRHYAQKIRDLGQSSKDTWINKLFNHIWKPATNGAGVPGGNDKEKRDKEKVLLSLPAKSAPVRPTSAISKLSVPPELANSPYLQQISKEHRIEIKTEKPKKRTDFIEKNKPKTVAKKLELSAPVLKKSTIDSPLADSIRHSKKAPSLPAEIERRAKSMTKKALKNQKVFFVEGPYPVDVFVRASLRKRGWVEKFTSQRMMQQINYKSNNNLKLGCETDEDFSSIQNQELPPAWEEENGVYALAARLVRSVPPRFVWACKSRVCEMVVRHEQLVNHFQKGRYFSSKVGLTNSLRDLVWINSVDSQSFFPRSYILNDDDKDDLVDDFRITSCISTLKCILKFYCHQDRRCSETSFRRENSKYEEVRHVDCEPFSTEDTKLNIPSPRVDLKSNLVKEPDTSSICIVEEDEIKEPERDVEPSNNDRQKTLPNLSETKKAKMGGQVPQQAVELALQHLQNFCRSKNHDDVEQNSNNKNLTKSQWSNLLDWCYRIQQDGAIVPVTESILKEIGDVLKKMKKLWPQYDLDGLKNIWIIKPGDKSKGIGIEFTSKLADMLKYVNNSTTSGTYVVQKYVETPLLIHGCKFDMRQWFLVTDWNPLTVWFYADSYLRICSQPYDSENMHESIHLSNVAVQQFYENSRDRSTDLPENNFMSSTSFKEYLTYIGHTEAWNGVIFPGMKEAVINCLMSTQDIPEMRKSAFELYGADFILAEDFKPWLLEINSSPGMAPTCLEKMRLCQSVIDDTIKVVIDKREDRNCSTGKFELAFRDQYVCQPRCVEPKMTLAGQRIRRLDLGRYMAFDAYFTKKDRQKEERQKKKKEQSEPTDQKPQENPLEEKDEKKEAIKISLTPREVKDTNIFDEKVKKEEKVLKSARTSSPSKSVPPTVLMREKQLAQIYATSPTRKS